MQIDVSTQSRSHRRWDIITGGLLLLWGVLLLGALGNTLHTVDNVRDFRVALNIANGISFPIASQPFAEQWQLPPAFFYTIALPLVLWKSEYAVFAFVALLVLGSVVALTSALRARYGRVVAACYVAFSIPAHGAVVFHGISNSALSFAAINGMLAALLGTKLAGGRHIARALLLAVLAVCMHPSAFVVVVPVCAASMRSHPRLWVRTLVSWPILFGSFALAIWVLRVGIRAPETPALPTVDGATVAAILGNVVDPLHWFHVWLTPWLHVAALLDISAWLRNSAMAFGVVFLCMAVGGMRIVWAHGEREDRALIIAACCTLLGAALWLRQWGFWYLDALWPMLAVMASVGAGGAIRRFSIARSRAMVAAFLVGGAFAVPCGVWITIFHTERYAVSTGGLFFPTPTSQDMPLHIPVATGFFRLRGFFVSALQCSPAALVGLDALWLDDLTLRALRDPCSLARDGPLHREITPKRYWLREDRDDRGMRRDYGDMPAIRFSGYSVWALPAIDVRVNGAAPPPLFSDQAGSRYSHFATGRVAANTTISVGPTANASSALHVAFRCLGEDARRIEDKLDVRGDMRQLGSRTLPPFTYAEFRVDGGAAVSPALRLRSSLPCDLSVWATANDRAGVASHE